MNLYNIYTESELVKSERDKLPDSSFGLPKTRQYPLHDAEHVRKAIQMFNHCSESNRKELASNIYKAAKRFDVEISEKALVFKYLTTTQQKEVFNKNSKRKELIESSSMLSFVEFYQYPLNEENIQKYGEDFKELSVLNIKPETKGIILVDKNDQVAGHIRIDSKTGYLKNIEVNPIYRHQGIGSKLLNTEIGRLASVTFIKTEDTRLQSFFENNGFVKGKDIGGKILMTRKAGLNESFELNVETINEELDLCVEKLLSNKDIVTETEDYLNSMLEASVAGVACVVPLAGQTIRKPYVVNTSKILAKKCPNMFDYDEFFEQNDSFFVCSETDNKGFTEPVDVARSEVDRDKNSTSTIKKPQAMMEDEDAINEGSGVVGAIIWDVIKFVVSLPFKIGKFVAKRIKESANYKIDKAIKEYRKAYDQCLDVSKLSHKSISLKDLAKELKVDTKELDKFKNTDALIKVTAWYKRSNLVSYFIEILETKNSTQYEYVIGIVDSEYSKEPTKTLLCAVMEYTTNSYGKYLERLNTILRKRGAKLLEETILFEDIDGSAAPDSEIVDYKDQSTDVIVGVDRYTCHNDNNGCYFIKLNDNEYEDQTRKELVLPYINEDMFITADLHLNHKNRNSANFANLMISEINAKVPIDGTLMICGDIGNKGQLQKEYISDFVSKLNVSKKILLLGNHDNLNLKDYYDMGFTFVTDIIETDKYIFSHCPVHPRDKINVHAHIHGEKEYWNIPADGHIDVYIGSHDNKVHTLKEYLEFYKKGKYKGKSITKKFD